MGRHLRLALLPALASAYRSALHTPTLRRGLTSTTSRAAVSSPRMAAAEVGDYVRLHYTLQDVETGDALTEAVFDTGDVSLVVGGGGFIPGLHSRIPELGAVGDPSTFELQPSECFGDAKPGLGPATVPASSAPAGLEVGMTVQLYNGMKAKVTAVSDESVTIDANHPLAGRAFTLTAKLTSAPAPAASALQTATFAGGCFWGLELAFQREPGVVSTAVGYTQGEAEDPSYEQVCSGSTGHTEAVRVMYDPSMVSFERLCDLFWKRLGDNRFLLNQVGNDRGTQYRHGIYTHSEEQLAIAKASLEAQQALTPDKPIQTELLPAQTFWEAEEYHQQYLQKGGQSAKKEATETIRCYG